MASLDRLAEFVALSWAGRMNRSDGKDEEKKRSNRADDRVDDEFSVQNKRYSGVSAGLSVIQSNTSSIDDLRFRNKTTADERNRKIYTQQLDKIMTNTNEQASFIKGTLDEIKRENVKYSQENGECTKLQMRDNLHQLHIRRCHSVIHRYNNAVYSFKQDLQHRLFREVKIVDPNLDDQTVQRMVESGTASTIIQTALIRDDLKDIVSDIEERHLDILRLEHQVQEIYELFKDLSTLVDLHQESVDIIENRITTANRYVGEGEVALNEAHDYQKKTRKKQCCVLFICLGLLSIILAPVLAFAAKKS